MANVFVFVPSEQPYTDTPTGDVFGAGRIHLFDNGVQDELDQANRIIAAGAGFDVSALVSALIQISWANITGKPSTFTPSAHTHAASEITSGVLDVLRIPGLDAAKIVSGVLDALRIPNLDAAKIATGIFDTGRIPDLAAAKIITGILDLARIPDLPASKVTSGTFANARIAPGNVTQHQAALTLNRSQISDAGALAGKNTVAGADLDAGAVTEDKLSAAVAEKLNRSAKNNFNATTDPGATDDSAAGYGEGSKWVNKTSDESFVCLDASVGAAIWANTSLTADDLGSLAFQEASNVNITGGVIAVTSATIGGVVISGGNVDGRDVSVDGGKLDAIEPGATADQTAEEIRDAYESNAGVNRFTDADHSKLDGIEAQATKNATDAALRDRSTHTGTQAQATIDGLVAALAAKVETDDLPFASVAEYTSTDAVTDIAAGATIGWDTSRMTDSAISVGSVGNTDITVAENGKYRIAVRLAYEDTSTEGVDVDNSIGVFFKLNGVGTGGQGIGSVVKNTAGANEGQAWFEQVIDIADFANQAITVHTQRLSGTDELYLRTGESTLIVERVGGKSALLAAQQISDVVGLQAALDAKLDDTQKGAANGLAELDGDGKVLTAQLPDSVLGALQYQGAWNASTNTPTIPAAASGNLGHYYRVSVAGSTNIDGETDWEPGDWLVSNGTSWDKIDNSEAITSVAGKSGDVTLDKTDVGLGNVDNTSDATKPVSTAQQAALDAKQAVSEKGAPNGYASLDGDGKVPAAQIPDGVGGVTWVEVDADGTMTPNQYEISLGNTATRTRNLPSPLVVGQRYAVHAKLGSARMGANGNTIRHKGVAIGGDLLMANGETGEVVADSTSTAEIV